MASLALPRALVPFVGALLDAWIVDAATTSRNQGPAYVQSGRGENVCPSGSEALSRQQCVAYGGTTGNRCGYEKDWNEGGNRPSGCFESQNGCVLFNSAQNGGRWSDVWVVCQASKASTPSVEVEMHRAKWYRGEDADFKDGVTLLECVDNCRDELLCKSWSWQSNNANEDGTATGRCYYKKVEFNLHTWESGTNSYKQMWAGPKPSAQDANQWFTEYLCKEMPENDRTITCSTGIILVSRAFFGGADDYRSRCPDGSRCMSYPSYCVGCTKLEDVTVATKTRCDGKSACVLDEYDDSGPTGIAQPDPCGGKEKYWKVTYMCQATVPTPAPPVYIFVSEKKHWTAAESDCVNKGGHLASIDSQDENDQVQSLCAGQPYCWIGGLKVPDDLSSGAWAWSDGTQPIFENFEAHNGGQRINAPGQPYTFLRPSTGQWQFEPDANDYAYVCEMEASDFTNADVDGNGFVDFEEALDAGLTKKQFHVLDADESGDLNEDEFAKAGTCAPDDHSRRRVGKPCSWIQWGGLHTKEARDHCQTTFHADIGCTVSCKTASDCDSAGFVYHACVNGLCEVDCAQKPSAVNPTISDEGCAGAKLPAGGFAEKYCKNIEGKEEPKYIWYATCCEWVDAQCAEKVPTETPTSSPTAPTSSPTDAPTEAPPPKIQTTGFCKVLCNGVFEHQGFTASGAPFYRKVGTDYHIFYDPDCNAGGTTGRWICHSDFDGPSTTRSTDLDNDQGCKYHARIDSNSRLPWGTQTWRVYCDKVWTDGSVTLQEACSSMTTSAACAHTRCAGYVWTGSVCQECSSLTTTEACAQCSGYIWTWSACQAVCPTYISVSGVESSQSTRMGTYTLRTIAPTSDNGGRQIWSNAAGQYLYYWAPYQNWRMGSDYTSAVAGLTSSKEAAACPDVVASWKVWDGSDWSSEYPVKVAEAASSYSPTPEPRYVTPEPTLSPTQTLLAPRSPAAATTPAVATPASLGTCCDQPCTSFACPSNYKLKTRASSTLENRSTCCDPDPSCEGYQCPGNYISKAGASSIVRTDYLSCCDLACSGFACPSNYMPKLTASRIVGNDFLTCCEEEIGTAEAEAATTASSSPDTVVLAVAALAGCSLLTLCATCLACKMLRHRQRKESNVIVNEFAYHTSNHNVTVNCTVGNPNSKGVNLQDVVTPSRWCVSVGQFFSFLDDVERCFTDGDPSCFEVADRLVKPATQASDCSYALMLNPAGIAATCYVIHSWGGCVFGLSAALRDAIGNTADQGVWICILSLPQTWDFTRLGNLLGVDPYLSPFYVALSAVSTVLAVRDPTSNIYSRLWCVFELWSSHELGKEILTLGRMERSIDVANSGSSGVCTFQRDADLLRPVLSANETSINQFIGQMMLNSDSTRLENRSAKHSTGSTTVIKAATSGPGFGRLSSLQKRPMPEGKTYHYFMSHKKHHSRLGNISASLALAIHDALDGKGFIGFYDVDDLESIDKEALGDAVEASCAMLVCFTDETCQSEWCRFEWEVARDNNIPTKGIVDLQNFDKKVIVEQIQQTNPFILKYQLGEYTERTRKQLTRDVAQWLEKRCERNSLGVGESSSGLRSSCMKRSVISASSKNSVSSSSTAAFARTSSSSVPEMLGKSTKISL